MEVFATQIGMRLSAAARRCRRRRPYAALRPCEYLKPPRAALVRPGPQPAAAERNFLKAR